MSPALLIVDDDDSIRETLSEILEEEGYVVYRAADGREALAILRAGAPVSVVLLDIMMPVMDGPTFRQEQLADAALRHIPVLVMTAAGPQAAARVPAAAVLHKPL